MCRGYLDASLNSAAFDDAVLARAVLRDVKGLRRLRRADLAGADATAADLAIEKALQ